MTEAPEPPRPWLSAGLALAPWGVFSLDQRIDVGAISALAFWPPWVWVVACGGALVVGGVLRWRRRQPQPRLAWGGLLLFALVFAEPLLVMARWAWPRSTEPGLIVVSANAARGDGSGARQALALRPDVLLLQESPAEATLAAACRELLGPDARWVWSGDASIIVRAGELTRLRDGRHFLAAAWTRGNERWLLVSLRLRPPRLPFDTKLRADHRAQIAALTAALDDLADPPFDAALIGGDFNAPARSPSFDPLRPRAQDAWRAAGRGWPGTVTARLPVSRFDAIWVSPNKPVLACEHLNLGVSDHRAVRARVSAR